MRTDPLATAFQSQFLANLGSLLIPDLSTFSLTVQDDAHNNGQSHSSGFDSDENLYLKHTNDGAADFRAAVQARATQLGANLSTAQVINRATAMSCAGCHNPSSVGLTFPGSVGPNQAWPTSLGFNHVGEVASNGVFPLSPALTDVFLPSRKADIEAFLQALPASVGASAPAAPSAVRTTATVKSVAPTPVGTGKRSG